MPPNLNLRIITTDYYLNIVNIFKKYMKSIFFKDVLNARIGIRTQVEASAGLQDIQATSCGQSKCFFQLVY